MTFFSRILFGAIGGLVGTGPMTIAMVKLHRMLPRQDQYPLPPKEITARLLDEAKMPLREENETQLTMLNHFAYGAGAGACYFLACPKPENRPIAKGVFYGLLIWAASYLGLLPGFGILKSATRQSPNRSLLMIAVHLIYGIFLASFVEAIAQDGRRTQGALVGKSPIPHKDAK
ncbi:MAG: DUF6789 family protein [Chthoniobacterales bacterium]